MDAFSNNFNENDVRMIAHEYLQWHYRKSDIIGGIYAETEAKTKAGKFADGFYAFRRTHNTIYIASLECKKELDSTSLDFRIHPERLVQWILIFASVFNIGFFILWFQYNKLFELYLEPLTIVLIVLFFLFLYRFTEKYFIKNEPKQLLIRNVLYQLEQYPADEQWLAFSMPNDNQLERFEAIKRDCNRKGIGLLLVDMSIEEVVWHKLPKSQTRHGFSYLKYYQKSEVIYNELMQHDTRVYQLNKRTPALKRQYWRIVGPLLLIVCTALYFRLSFNDLVVPIATAIQENEEQVQNQLETQQTEYTIQQTIVQEQETEPVIASTTVVLDNIYDNLEAAEWRVKKLHQLGLEAKLGNLSDYQIDLSIDKDYFVFLDDEKGELQLLYNDYQEKLFNTGVEFIGAKIIEIEEK
jgi:hypothetical protein